MESCGKCCTYVLVDQLSADVQARTESKTETRNKNSVNDTHVGGYQRLCLLN